MSIFDLVPFRQRRSGAPAAMDRNRDPVLALESDVDRAFDNFWNMVSLPISRNVIDGLLSDGETDFKIDVRDKDNEVDIVAELPGLSEDDIEVTVDTGGVTIRAEREEERDEREGPSMVRERRFGMIQRTIPLPPGALPEKVTARFRNGILKVTVPKSRDAQSRRRRIEIHAS
jgi:HSP20 family protein